MWRENRIYQMICEFWQMMARRNDRLFRENADFSGWMTPEEAGFDADHGHQYQPCTDTLVKVLKKLPISRTDAILDLGCGKGKAMYLMSRFPFRKVGGYDLSGELVHIANENFEHLGVPRCHAVQADAVSYEDYDEYTYFYMFNPFPREVFEAMMGHLLESIRRRPRTCRFIYLHPEYHEYFIKHTPFRLIYKKKSLISWFDYYCYECRG